MLTTLPKKEQPEKDFQPVDKPQVILSFFLSYTHGLKRPESFIHAENSSYSQIHTPYCECDENPLYISL